MNTSVIEHKPLPQYVPVNRRYQCKQCHNWINYSEADGRWHHVGEQ